jgi:hypothetical protein
MDTHTAPELPRFGRWSAPSVAAVAGLDRDPVARSAERLSVGIDRRFAAPELAGLHRALAAVERAS